MKIITTRARAFAGQAIRSHKFAIDTDGTVKVWDSVAGHFTACHSLGKSAIARIRKMAITA